MFKNLQFNKLSLSVTWFYTLLTTWFNTGFIKYFVDMRINTLPNGFIRIGKKKDFETNVQNVADIQVRDSSIYYDIITMGELGLGRGYVSGKWTTSNLEKLMTVLCRNINHFQKELTLFNFASQFIIKSKNIVNDKKYIQHHYDVGNDFYETFLDTKFRAYSTGFYETFDGSQSIDDAINNKIDYIITKLDISSDQIVLDIGCGWGKIAEYIQTERKCIVHGVTVSDAQIEYIRKNSPNVIAFNKDYRKIDTLPILYDRAYSIEMLEHVGYDNYKIYFEKVSKQLKEGSKFVLQITVSLREGEESKSQSQYILTDVYPGGQIPKIGKVLEAIKDISDLRLTDMRLFDGKHFAQTFREWNKKMLEKNDNTLPLVKSFEYYFNSCIGLFQNNVLATCVFVLEKNTI